MKTCRLISKTVRCIDHVDAFNGTIYLDRTAKEQDCAVSMSDLAEVDRKRISKYSYIPRSGIDVVIIDLEFWMESASDRFRCHEYFVVDRNDVAVLVDTPGEELNWHNRTAERPMPAEPGKK